MIIEENFVDFKCPHCGELVSFPRDSIGFVQECPGCADSLIVPEPGSEVGRKLPLPITTPRLKLRRFTGNDWKGLMELVLDEEGFASVDGLPGKGEEEVTHWLESDSHIRLSTPDQMFHLAVELQESGKLIGFVGLWFTDAQRLQAMFNLSVHRNHQHQGLGREAAEGVLGFFFDGIRLHRVTVRCDSRDSAACRLLEKVGMRREGEFVKDTPLVEGGWANSVWYSVLEEEYGKPDGGTAPQVT